MNANEAKQLFTYEPSTGVVRWLIGRNAGKIAGSYHKVGGYTMIVYKRKYVYAHRIAMLLTHGDLPEKAQIDHINHNRSDNRLENLRITDHENNGRNVSMMRTNTTGVVGVVYLKKNNKYMAQIYVNKKRKYLGIYETLEEAAIVRKSAEFLYGYHSNHGK